MRNAVVPVGARRMVWTLAEVQVRAKTKCRVLFSISFLLFWQPWLTLDECECCIHSYLNFGLPSAFIDKSQTQPNMNFSFPPKPKHENWIRFWFLGIAQLLVTFLPPCIKTQTSRTPITFLVMCVCRLSGITAIKFVHEALLSQI